MLVTAWITASLSIASAGSTANRINAMEDAWSKVDAYCSRFVVSFHSDAQSTMSLGKTCWSKAGQIRTELQSSQGPIIEIRGEREVWYHNPARPVVVHLSASSDFDLDTKQIGRGIGELIDLLSKANNVRDLGSVELGGQKTWRFEVPRKTGNVIVFVDAKKRLPVAVELRTEDRPLMSYGFTDLMVNPQIPKDFFTIKTPENYPVVDLHFDPKTNTPSELLQQLQKRKEKR